MWHDDEKAKEFMDEVSKWDTKQSIDAMNQYKDKASEYICRMHEIALVKNEIEYGLEQMVAVESLANHFHILMLVGFSLKEKLESLFKKFGK